MDEYISREALLEATRKRIKEANSYRMAVVDNEFIDIINDAESVDVVEIEAALNFIRGYAFKDRGEIYTNGSILVPLFRVEQALVDKAYRGLKEQ